MRPSLLIVEPEEGIGESLAQFLSSWFEVGRAATVREALATMEGCPAQLVLTEVELPDGYGPGFLAEIRSRWPETKIAIVYVYSHRTQELEAILERLGDVCVRKPFDLEKIGTTLRGLAPGARGVDLGGTTESDRG